jgi:ubiquinone/menaquinone biosynthesis C-methylase UbiE
MPVADPRIAFFDGLAERWDDENPSAERMVARLAQHADMLALQSGESLLEVGCGTGKTTGYLVEQIAPGRVTAIDFAPKMIDRAQAKNIDADFQCMDICSDDLGTALYDVVLCFHSFPHFRDQPAALRNLRRAMKDTGRLIIMHCAGSDHINQFHANLTGAVNQDLLPVDEEWEALLDDAGLMSQTLIDRDDLFILIAQSDPRAQG